MAYYLKNIKKNILSIHSLVILYSNIYIYRCIMAIFLWNVNVFFSSLQKELSERQACIEHKLMAVFIPTDPLMLLLASSLRHVCCGE